MAVRDSASQPYHNTIPLENQAKYPGDVAIEERITSIIRWNALAMVARANAAHGELGGHIASYAFGSRNLRGRL
jgi:pyruvate dehydrogenase E1 component